MSYPAADRPGERYDAIGDTYARYRVPDPRIVAAIEDALGSARTVVDVGSGTGSYEPAARGVVAVEPSWRMIEQRGPGAAPVVRAVAERLPFGDAPFDAALAVLTVHHWSDAHAGFAEMQRVARRQVILTWDPIVWSRFWLVDEYLPELPELERGVTTVENVTAALEVREVRAVPVPIDCTDGFCGAYWGRPNMYLDAGARGAISGFSLCPPDAVARCVSDLERDLRDGSWKARHGELLKLKELDLGYRLVVAGR